MVDDDTPGMRAAHARAKLFRLPWYREEMLGRSNWQWAVLTIAAMAINLIAYMMK